MKLNLTLALALIAAATSACTKTTSTNGRLSITGGNAALVAKPSDPTSELAQLQRYRGQTSFLDRESMWRDGRAMPAPPSGGANAPKAPGSAQRDQQESDVFKVGAAGSKLLYLMNQYRGLQVVSFAKGADQPELLGRAATSGNSVDQMYADLRRNRLISIEHDYKYADGKDQSHSLLGVYDVSDSSKPKLARTVDIQGLVMDSRIVGDVLYVASRDDDKGLVTSYSLTSPDLHQVEQRTLTQKVAYGENMNIVQQGDDYYLVAVLADKGWGWWTESSVIDVIDISDAHGKIKPLMSVATRGFVRERSQTSIKNRTLIVTSNYDTKTQRTPLLRIAVETFKFPETTSEVLTDDEATFRRLNIERQLQGHYGVDLDQLRDKLMNDAQLGLKGRFVRSGDTLKKIVSDSIVTVGDGSGLSAQLQDVRVGDNSLYAFWVPRDQMDPFDLFDLSHPENGIAYLGRLHFDGWIERAIPYTFGGRKFVLGLGWVLPVQDNDTGRRVPQAMLFEVKQQGKTLKAIQMGQLSLEGSNIYTNFNSADKMVEVRETTAGQGEILFGAEKFGQGDFNGGGQIIRFDLSKADSGDALTQGPFLAGGADWIRRVFTNPEIGRINSFSDHALATFSAPQASVDMHPVNILELARNIVGYEVLSNTGVQIVTDGYWASSGSTTSLRAVATDHVDAEAAQTVSTLTLPGRYTGRLLDSATGDLLVLTDEYTSSRDINGKWVFSSAVHLTRVNAVGGQLKVVSKADWNTTSQTGDSLYMGDSLLRLADGSILAQVGSVIRRIESVSANLGGEQLTLEANCAVQDRDGFQVATFNGTPYLKMEQRITSKDFDNETFVKHFLAPVDVKAKSIACKSVINIPGEAKVINAGGELMVEDTWVTDLRKADKYYEAKTQHSLLSLSIASGVATLKDEIALEDQTPSVYPWRMAASMSTPCRGCWSRASDFRVNGNELVDLKADGSNGELTVYRVGQDSMLEKDTRSFSTGFDSDAQVLALSTSSDTTTAVLKADRQVQIVRWTKQDLRPQVLKIQVVNERNEVQPATDVATIPGSYWSVEGVHFGTDSVELAQGWNGLTQLRLQK